MADKLDSFIDKYLERGFGSMNKNDFEVWIFNEMLQMDEYKNLGNYDLSLKLHIPESKIKRLRYESSLRYSAKSKDDYKQDVRKLLQQAQLRAADKKIVLQVEDVMLKLYVSSILKQSGRSVDSSFNPELVVIHINDFQYLAESIFTKDEVEEILSEAKKSSKVGVDWSKIMEIVISGAISGVASGVTSMVIHLTPASIVNTLKSFISQP